MCATKLRDRIENQYFDGGSSILSSHTHTHPPSPLRAVAPERTERATKLVRRCLLSSVQTRTNKSRDLLYTIKKYNVGNCQGLVHTLCATFFFVLCPRVCFIPFFKYNMYSVCAALLVQCFACPSFFFPPNFRVAYFLPPQKMLFTYAYCVCVVFTDSESSRLEKTSGVFKSSLDR